MQCQSNAQVVKRRISIYFNPVDCICSRTALTIGVLSRLARRDKSVHSAHASHLKRDYFEVLVLRQKVSGRRAKQKSASISKRAAGCPLRAVMGPGGLHFAHERESWPRTVSPIGRPASNGRGGLHLAVGQRRWLYCRLLRVSQQSLVVSQI